MNKINDQVRYERSRIKASFDAQVLSWKLDTQIRKLRNQKANINSRLGSLDQELKEIPAMPQDLIESRSAILVAASRIQEIEEVLQDKLQQISSLPSKKLSPIVGELNDLRLPPTFTGLIHRMSTLISQAETSWEQHLQDMKKEVTTSVHSFQQLRTRWNTDQTDLEDTYQKEVQLQGKYKNRLVDREKIELELHEVEKQISLLESERDEIRKSADIFNNERENILEVINKRHSILKTVAAEFQGLSKGLARAEVVTGANSRKCREAIEGLVHGSHVRRERVDELFTWIVRSDNPHQVWRDLQDECVQHLRKKELGGTASQTLEDGLKLGELGQRLNLNDRFFDQLTAERVGQVLTAFLEDSIELYYIRGEDDEVPFHLASPGEQAAALLTSLLSQEGGPLLIDQPENDLDNKIISTVVEYVRDAKKFRQIIVATHNANLVVNGDAEQVLEFRPSDNTDRKYCELAASGAIDLKGIKNAITLTMEGGREAFELRRLKYDF